jgi:hypothetical protein
VNTKKKKTSSGTVKILKTVNTKKKKVPRGKVKKMPKMPERPNPSTTWLTI